MGYTTFYCGLDLAIDIKFDCPVLATVTVDTALGVLNFCTWLGFWASRGQVMSICQATLHFVIPATSEYDFTMVGVLTFCSKPFPGLCKWDSLCCLDGLDVFLLFPDGSSIFSADKLSVTGHSVVPVLLALETTQWIGNVGINLIPKEYDLHWSRKNRKDDRAGVYSVTIALDSYLSWSSWYDDGTTFIGTFATILERTKQSEWLILDTSVIKSPDRSLLTNTGVPAKLCVPFRWQKVSIFPRKYLYSCPE